MKLGFEAEFHTGVEALATALHGAGMSGSDHMHSYHCGCDDCVSWDWTFRVQSDSSCGGEIISHPFTDWRALRRAINKLSTLAVELDAEPGMDSGFHVHSSVERLSITKRLECLVQFIRWEPALELLAQGRFTDMRGFNHTARSTFYRMFPDEDYNAPPVNPLTCYEQFMDCGDRHCALNMRTRNLATFEFRLWNSTRAGWRMHMFAGLSHMFTHLPFIEKIAAQDVSGDTEQDALVLRNAYAECAPRSTVPSYIDKQLACESTNRPFTVPFVEDTTPLPAAERWAALRRTLGARAAEPRPRTATPSRITYRPDSINTTPPPTERYPLVSEAEWANHEFPDCTFEDPCDGCWPHHPEHPDHRPSPALRYRDAFTDDFITVANDYTTAGDYYVVSRAAT